MKLLSLKLLHFRRFRQEEIIFGDDFSLIFWKNGAGKSSVLDAIGFALFGPTSKDFVRVNTTYLKSHFLHDREPSKIELTFQYGLDTYRIVRVIDAGTKKFASDFIAENKDSLFGPEDLVILWGGEVSSYVIDLLWVSRDTFLRSVFAKQKDLEVLSGNESERKDLIHSILGLDKIEQLTIEQKRILREKNTALEYLQKKQSLLNEEELKEKYMNLQSLWKEKNTLVVSLWEEKKYKESLMVESKKMFDTHEKKKEAFVRLNNEKIAKQTKKQSLLLAQTEKQQEIASLKEKEIFLQQNEFLIEKEASEKKYLLELEQKKQQFLQKNSYELSLEKYKNEQKEIEIKLQQYQNVSENKETLQTQILQIQKELQAGWELIASLQTELQNIKNQAEEIKKEQSQLEHIGHHADCPTCKRPLQEQFPYLMTMYEGILTQKREQYKQIMEQKNKQDEENAIKQKQFLSLQNQWQEIEKQEKDLLILTQKKSHITEQVFQITKQLEPLALLTYDETEHKNAVQTYRATEVLFQEYQKIRGQVEKKVLLEQSLVLLSQELVLLETQIKEGELQMMEIGFDELIYQTAKSNMQQTSQDFYEINERFSQWEKESLQLQYEMQRQESELQNFIHQKEEIQTLKKEILSLQTKIGVLWDYIQYLLAYLKPNIEDLASYYLNVITDNKYSQISLDEKYNILIDYKPIDLYSGGERDLANLCFRLALWQNISSKGGNSINFLVLDEILASQDKTRQQNIFLHLRKLENKFSQIILISHLEEMKELANHLIEISAKDIHESEVVYHW